MKNEEFCKDLEQLLKSKMDELADSVDCFDKITERAFPADNEDFSESGFTVTDLETVSSDTKKHRIIKWTALAGAAAAAVFLLPKTGLPQRALMLISGGQEKCVYEEILGEIESITEDDSYYVMDVPLDYYIENDILVTPLMSCPFEKNDRDDANVRLYIRQIDGWDTNQVYAVEYLGTYSEKNIVAAAKSSYTITAEDLEQELSEPEETPDFAAASAYNCVQSGKEGVLIDIEGNAVSLASFEYNSVVKDESGIRKLKTSVLYGTRLAGFGEEVSYFYDIMTHTVGDEPAIPEADKMWENSVYFNGNSAFPQETGTVYTRETLLLSAEDIIRGQDVADYVAMPVSEDWAPPFGMRIGLRGTMLQNQISDVTCPMNQSAALNLKLYFSLNTIFTYDSYDDPYDTYNDAVVELVEYSENVPLPVYGYTGAEINVELFNAENITSDMETYMREEVEKDMLSLQEKLEDEAEKAEKRREEEKVRMAEAAV